MKDMICELSADQQTKIKAEVTEAYQFFGYDGKRLKDAVALAMNSSLADVSNLLGAYRYILDNEEVTARIICGESVDSAMQSQF